MFHEGFDPIFRTLSHFEEQAHDGAPELDGIRVGASQSGVLFEDIEIGGDGTGESSEVVETLSDGEVMSENHSVGVDHLEVVFSEPVVLIEDVRDVEIQMEDAGPVHPEEEIGEGIESRSDFGTLRVEFGDGFHRQIVGAEGDEEAVVKESVPSDFDPGDLFGGIDAEISESGCMTEGAFSLAAADDSVNQTIE